MSKKIALIVGTRPEAIKLAPVYLRFKAAHPEVQALLWSTGQHLEMLQQAMQVFGLTADEDFKVMTPGQSVSMVTSKVLSVLESTFALDRPDLVIVQGDTTTAFAGALASFYARIPVAHVEAGLRTRERYSPFPEEINRQLVARLSSLAFAPTELSRRNLLAEGIPPDSIFVTGNTVIDALALVVQRVRKVTPTFPPDLPSLPATAKICLITGHRRENFGSGFLNLCAAIAELAHLYPEVEFIFPVHLNPHVREPVFSELRGIRNIHLIEPLQYEQFVWLMDRCVAIVSDSGGIQEEASYLGTPVFVMRESTERPEGIEAGTSIMVGTTKATIVDRVGAVLGSSGPTRRSTGEGNTPFGDGHAAERICRLCSDFLA